MLSHIRTEARRRAALPRTVDPQSKFVERLRTHYLAEYLAAPSPATGKAAIERIGAQFAGQAQDQWEGLGSSFNNESVPNLFRRIRPGLPERIAGATDIISIANQSVLPYVDVPHLLGDLNPSRSIDTEVDYQGRNISHLLHWATGVKYQHVDSATLRELFLGYELWHLEQWDAFAEDPVNDLIVEDQGRHLGQRLARGAVNSANLNQTLTEGFVEARAWMGSILRLRQDQLDAQITSDQPAATRLYFSPAEPKHPYGLTTISRQLQLGWDPEAVQRWPITEKYIELYTMIYEAEAWQRRHGRIHNTRLLQAMARGDLNHVIDTGRSNGSMSRWEMFKLFSRIVDGQVLKGLIAGAPEERRDP